MTKKPLNTEMDRSSCEYNQGVICGWQFNCERCGWNPKVSEERKKRKEKKA